MSIKVDTSVVIDGIQVRLDEKNVITDSENIIPYTEF